MSKTNNGISAIGRLAALALMAAAFLFGLAGVVYMALQGAEIQVPEVTGKDLSASEKELALLGLRIKKRADRFSQEQPNTVIEQLPKAGETVKSGQMILVVTSKGPGEGDVPASLKEATEKDDSEKIEEMISDKPKKSKPAANANRKKADTARDVNASSANSSSGTGAGSDSNKKEAGGATPSKPKESQTSPPVVKPKTDSGDTKPTQPGRR